MRIDDGKDDATHYKVLVNPEGQYSIWPAERKNPAGWTDAGKAGTKAECVAYIAEARTDIRLRSLRGPTEMRSRHFGDPFDELGVPTRDPEAGPDRGGCPV